MESKEEKNYRIRVITKANGDNVVGDTFVQEMRFADPDLGVATLSMPGHVYKHIEPSGAATYIPWHNIDNIYISEVV